MKKIKRLSDAYRFPGFKPKQVVKGIFGDSKARVIKLNRIEKKHAVPIVGKSNLASTTEKSDVSAIFPVATCGSFSIWRCVVSNAGIAAR